MLAMDPVLFAFLAPTIVFFAVAMVLSKNPIHSAIYLSVVMVLLAFLYLLLGAYFVSAVQLAVYAGAVMVLFVMVLMIFDLKALKSPFSPGRIERVLKVMLIGWLVGLISGTLVSSFGLVLAPETTGTKVTTKALAETLFSEYVYAFEILGILLLCIAIGAVALSRAKGGTHHES